MTQAAFPQQYAPGKPNLSGTWKLNLKRSGPVLPRGTEALTLVIDHQDPWIVTSESRTVFGKTTRSAGKRERIDGRLQVDRSTPGKTVRSRQQWDGPFLVTFWRLTESGVSYTSGIRTSLSSGGQVLTMAEHYDEPGMKRIRDWVFEKQ